MLYMERKCYGRIIHSLCSLRFCKTEISTPILYNMPGFSYVKPKYNIRTNPMGILYRFVYYFILKSLSFLPFWVLQRLSDFLYYIIYYLVGFRKKVVFQNLNNSFPDKHRDELSKIAKKFTVGFNCEFLLAAILSMKK